MKYVRFLELNGTGIRELPSSVGNLTELQVLDLSECQDLRHLPNSVLHLQHLRYLDLNCSSVKKRQYPLPSITELFPSLPPIMNPSFSDDGYFSSTVFPELRRLKLCQRLVPEPDLLSLATCYSTLEDLDLSESNLVILPKSIKGFVKLQTLKLSDCKQLKEILELPPNVIKVNVNGCISLESFAEVYLRKLRWINMSGCHKMVVNPLLFEQNIEEHRDCELIYPGNKIPDLDYHGKVISNSPYVINVEIPYSDEIKGIITCAVVVQNDFTPDGQDHVVLHYEEVEENDPPEDGLKIEYHPVTEVLIKSLRVGVVRKKKEINTLQIVSWRPCVNIQFSMSDDDDNENPEEDLDSELGVGCSEGAIFDALRCFVAFLAAKLQLGRCMGLIRR